ncbi:MAG TPA: TonB C-terminal domain-containing protein [Desulfobacterales bacterium]|nr:TonB C-terminal domain-containing protein [Desulfobacterales bacterium]
MTEFFSLAGNGTQAPYWKMPLVLTALLHLAVFLLLIMPPSFLRPRHNFQEIQTINLFTAVELKARLKPPRRHTAPPRVSRPSRPRRQAPPPPVKEVKSINIDQPPSLVPAKPAKVVSLRPRKLKKRVPPLVKHEKINDELLRRGLAGIRARLKAKQEARQVKSALAELVKNLQAAKPAPAPPKNKPVAPAAPDTAKGVSAGSQSNQAARNAAEAAGFKLALRRYYMLISLRIHEHWSLPKTHSWDKSLEAVVVINIRRDGIVSKITFEKKSDNMYFNQYVKKTIEEASPMPPFPSDLKRERLEIGLRFMPGGML